MSTSDTTQESAASDLPPRPQTSPDSRLSILQILGIILLCLGWLGLIVISGSRTSGHVVSPPTAAGGVVAIPTQPSRALPPVPEPKAWVATEKLRLFDDPYQGQVRVEVGGGTAMHLTGQSPKRKWSFVTLVDGTSGWVRTDRLRISSDPLALGTVQLPAAPAEFFADDFETASGEWISYGNSILSTDGALVFRPDDCSVYLLSCHPLSFSDAQIEFEVISSGNVSSGLMFRWWNGYGYRASIEPNGFLWVGKVTDSRPVAHSITENSNLETLNRVTWKSLYYKAIETGIQKNAQNTIRLVLFGDLIQVYVNSYPVAEVADRSYEGGEICFYAANPAGGSCMPGEARFDNLQVRQLSEDSSYVTQTTTPNATKAGPTPTITARLTIVDPTPEPGTKCRFMHVVRPTDNWPSIERRYGVSMPDIQQANQMDTSVNPQCCLNSGKEPAQILCIP